MRKWAYAYIEINGDKKDARSLNFPVIEFQSDNKYILNYAEITEEGTWNLKNDTLLSTTNKANNFTQDLIVLKLQNDTFRLKSANENDDLILTLTPFQVE